MISIKHEKLSYESKTVRSEMFYTIIKKLTEKSARGTFIHTPRMMTRKITVMLTISTHTDGR